MPECHAVVTEWAPLSLGFRGPVVKWLMVDGQWFMGERGRKDEQKFSEMSRFLLSKSGAKWAYKYGGTRDSDKG